MSKLIEKILKEYTLSEAKNNSIIVYRLEFKNTHAGPFNWGDVADKFHYSYFEVLEEIRKRFTENFPGKQYELKKSENYLFAFLYLSNFKKYFGKDLRILSKIGFKIKKYETSDYIFLDNDEVVFNIKTAKKV